MSDNLFKPLLAATLEDTSKLNYPVLVSIKLDGLRCTIHNGVVMSRSMKPIRSKAVQELFGRSELNGLDAEILYGPWNDPLVFNKTTSAVMATELKGDMDKSLLKMAVFDYFLNDSIYNVRYLMAEEIVKRHGKQMEMLAQVQVDNEEELLDFEREALDNGFEGIMVRSIHGKYKQGRSTLKDGIINKLKRFSDDEGLIIGFQEKMTNTNESKINEVGRSQRSQALEGMVGANTLGAFVCTCKGIEFTCGSGLDDAMRKEVWENKDKYLGRFIKFKHFEIGKLVSYRFPIWLGFRDIDDMS